MKLSGKTANLNNRALVLVTGEEAEKFLQAVITTDLDNLGADDLKPGALLAPQGKIMFDFLVSSDAVSLALKGGNYTKF